MIFKFYPFFDEIPLSKQNSPRWDMGRRRTGVTSGAMLFAYVPYKGCQAYVSYCKYSGYMSKPYLLLNFGSSLSMDQKQ